MFNILTVVKGGKKKKLEKLEHSKIPVVWGHLVWRQTNLVVYSGR